MAKVQEAEIVDEQEQTAAEINRETEWFDGAIPSDMIRLPYVYLMNGGSEIDKLFPGSEGQYYLSSLGKPIEDGGLMLIPVRVGKRLAMVERNGQEVEEEEYRLLAVTADSGIPVIWTLRGTAKDALRQALGGITIGGPGLRGGAWKMHSMELTNKKRQSWYVPVFEPMEIAADTCRALVAAVFDDQGALLPIGNQVAGATVEDHGDGLPF